MSEKHQFDHAMRPVGECIPRTVASINWRSTVSHHRCT